MKICLLAARNSIHTVRWANALAQRSHEVHLISMHTGGDPLDPRVVVHRLFSSPPWGYYLNRFQLRSLLMTIRPSVLHAHYASGYGTLARLCGWHPYILSVWGSDIYEYPYQSQFNLRTIRKNLGAADCVLSTSRAMAAQVSLVSPETHVHRVTPFGVDCDVFYPSHGHDIGQPICIGTVKGLNHYYGIDTLLRAFALLHEMCPSANVWRGCIYGGGPLEGDLRTLCGGLGLSCIVEMRGAIPHAQVPETLRNIQVFCALSRQESFGVSVLEASSCGVPVVVTDIGGLPEVVRDKETGILVPPEDPLAAATAIYSLVQDADIRTEMGLRGAAFVRSHYAWGHSVDLMLSIYEDFRR